MKIVPYKSIKITDIIRVLKNNGLVIVPSDTVYGLLVDAKNNESVRKLIEFKNRPPGKPISIFVSDFSMMNSYAYISDQKMKILQQMLPGPFTVILNSKHNVSQLLESEKKTLGLRYPDNVFVTSLVRRYASPLTATSANLSAGSPHYSIDSLLQTLSKKKKDLVELVIDKGKLPHNKPSTILDLTSPSIKILRHGDIVFSHYQAFESISPSATQKIARYLFSKHRTVLAQKPLVFIIQGDLGVGKTVFVKGIAESFGIDSIISPTFVVYYEYPIHLPTLEYLYHFDLYNVLDREELTALKIPSLLKPRRLFCFEWGEKSGDFFQELKEKAEVIYIKMSYKTRKKRILEISH